MSNAVLYMSMSLDGFIAGPNEGPGNGLGDRGHRLHEWFLTDPDASHEGATDLLTGANREVMDEVMSTGAVVPAGGPSSSQAAGAATTTTACRSSS
jgi:hypothetical protein